MVGGGHHIDTVLDDAPDDSWIATIPVTVIVDIFAIVESPLKIDMTKNVQLVTMSELF